MTEQWQRIDADGEYEISNRGRLRRIIKGSTGGSGGYCQFTMPINGKSTPERGHRLVARYFLNGGEPLLPGVVVDHINGDRADNRVDNLRIVTQKVNGENHEALRTVIRAAHLKELEEAGRLLPTTST